MCVAVIAGQFEANVGAGTWSVQHHSPHPGQFTTGSHTYWVLSRYETSNLVNSIDHYPY